MANQQPISLIQFQKKFASEETCQSYLFTMKWSKGFRCAKCGHDHYYEIKTRKLNLYECRQCGYQATVIVDTVMEKTRVDLTKWFWAIYLVAHDKRGVSAVMLSLELEVSYKTAWLMLHKIRKAMGERDSKYTLAGIVELDETFVGAPSEGGKRGRGTEKTKVIVGLSLNQIGHPLYVKMEVIPDMKGETLVDFANRTIEHGSVINSDAYKSYKALAKKDYQHNPQEFNHVDNPDHLKWPHIVISNVKTFIGGTYHGLDSKHLQSYLNEFCYRFNRRKFQSQLFNRLLSCCSTVHTITYSELTA